MITGLTQVYGLIGNPVAQSFSPFIHNMLAEAMGLDMTYVTFPVAKGQLENAYKGMLALGISGMNVTVPYKSDIMEHIDLIDSEAANIGAVNTLVYNGNSIKGYNTDWVGLRQSLYRNQLVIRDKRVLIIGAGGSARAAAVMCAKEGASKITIANRTISKAEDIRQLIVNNYTTGAIASGLENLDAIAGSALIFQTTPIGMYPKPEAMPIRHMEVFDDAEVAVDLIYNPAETAFLKAAREKGCQVINGMEMLFYQAVKAFELWNNLEVPTEVQNKCLKAFETAVLEKK